MSNWVLGLLREVGSGGGDEGEAFSERNGTSSSCSDVSLSDDLMIVSFVQQIILIYTTAACLTNSEVRPI